MFFFVHKYQLTKAVTQFFKNVLKFLPSVYIGSYQQKPPVHTKVICWLKELEILRHSFLLALLRLSVHAYSTVVKKCEPCGTFFRNHERNRVPEISLSYSQNMPSYFPSGRYKLSICLFLEYCYTIVMVDDISRPSNGCLLYDRNVYKILSALNLTLVCINSFTSNKATFSVFFLNEMLFLN